MAKMIEMTCICGCGRSKAVRASDVKRGWGKYFSKSCAAGHRSNKTFTKLKGKPKPVKPRKAMAGEKVCELAGCNKKARKRFCCNKHKDRYHNMQPHRVERTKFNNHDYMGSGVTQEKFERYQEEYGGTPQFNRNGEYEGMTLSGSDFSVENAGPFSDGETF